jgi:hypothetical protein
MRIEAITIYPNIYIVGLDADMRLLRHEYEHLKQMERLGRVKFYLSYVYEFILGFIEYRNWSDAYHSISFEFEAYLVQSNIYDDDFQDWFNKYVLKKWEVNR